MNLNYIYDILDDKSDIVDRKVRLQKNSMIKKQKKEKYSKEDEEIMKKRLAELGYI